MVFSSLRSNSMFSVDTTIMETFPAKRNDFIVYNMITFSNFVCLAIGYNAIIVYQHSY